MKILLINNQFSIGGAARVAAIMCNSFYERGYDLCVMTDYLSYELGYGFNKNISLSPLVTKDYTGKCLHKLRAAIHIIQNIRRTIQSFHPDVIITIQADMYLRTLLAGLFLDCTIIAADHSTITHKYDLITDFTRSYLYRFADGLSILTEKDRKLLGQKFPNKEVIYNPLSFPIKREEHNNRRMNILCAGRLDAWKIKGFDIMLNIWASINDKYPDWDLEIAGSGNQDSVEFLQHKIEDLGLQNRVKLLGFVEDMKSLFGETSIFALPSRVEGFPMVLMEALSQGCASVSFSIQGATNEMVLPNAGLVIEDGDFDGFKKAICTLLDSASLRQRLSLKARESVERFSVDSFINHWIDFINKTLERN